MQANPKGHLQLFVHAASTPARVLAAATMFDEVLRTAYPHLPSDSVTMVVSNRDMRSGLRWFDTSGKSALDGIIKLIATPTRTVTAKPSYRAVAEIISKHSAQFIGLDAEFRTPRKLLRKIDEDFVSLMRNAATDIADQRKILRGPTVVYSPVYRVGRVDDKSKAVKARIVFDGKIQEVRVAAGKEGQFFDAAKSGKVFSIYLDAAWIRNDDDDLEFFLKQSKATTIEPWDGIAGDDIMQMVSASPIGDYSMEDVIADVEGL